MTVSDKLTARYNELTDEIEACQVDLLRQQAMLNIIAGEYMGEHDATNIVINMPFVRGGVDIAQDYGDRAGERLKRILDLAMARGTDA